MSLLASSILIGLVVGIIAKLLTSGHEPGAWVASLILGLAGSVIASYTWRVAGCHHEGSHLSGYLASIVGAIILLVLYRLLRQKK